MRRIVMPGMSISTFTRIHVAISLTGITAVVLFRMLSTKRPCVWTTLFFAAIVLTSATGFFFPCDHVLPPHAVGILSLAVLAILVLYPYRLTPYEASVSPCDQRVPQYPDLISANHTT
jgi:hypothetical protein